MALQVDRDDSAAQAKAQAAERLYLEAQKHKRLANRHKRRARSAMAQFAQFKADLEAMGITVVIEQPHTRQEGGESDRSDRST